MISAMTSRERVLAAFAHEEADRVPAWCGASTGFWEKAKSALQLDDEGLRQRLGDDFRRVFAPYKGPLPELPPEATSVTPFGVLRAGLEYGQPIHHPLAEATVEQVHDYPWPDPELVDVSQVRSQAAAYDGQYAILGGDWSPFWHDLIDLLGMENMYLKMYDQPELIDAVLEHRRGRRRDRYFLHRQRLRQPARATAFRGHVPAIHPAPLETPGGSGA